MLILLTSLPESGSLLVVGLGCIAIALLLRRMSVAVLESLTREKNTEPKQG